MVIIKISEVDSVSEKLRNVLLHNLPTKYSNLVKYENNNEDNRSLEIEEEKQGQKTSEKDESVDKSSASKRIKIDQIVRHEDRGGLEERRITRITRQTEQGASNICEDCGEIVATYYELAIHKKMHRAVKYKYRIQKVPKRSMEFDNGLKCNQCGVTSSSEGKMKKHIQVHEEQRVNNKATKYKFRCLQCRKKFNQLAKLLLHRKSHKNRQEELCHPCNKRQKNLPEHYQNVHCSEMVI